MKFVGRWINVESDIKNENIIDLLKGYDDLITQYVDLIPMSDVLGSDDEYMTKFMGIYKSTLNVCNTALEVVINQDNMIRHITDQNTEILKKLDELSKKTK